LGRRTAYQLDSLGLSGFTPGLEKWAMPSRGSLYSRVSGWSLRGGLWRVAIGGVGYVLVPRGAERRKNVAADWTGTIERGMLAITVDAEGS